MRHSIHCFLLISAMLLFAGCGGGGGGNVKLVFDSISGNTEARIEQNQDLRW